MIKRRETQLRSVLHYQLSVERLISMKKYVFGLGTAQVIDKLNVAASSLLLPPLFCAILFYVDLMVL